MEKKLLVFLTTVSISSFAAALPAIDLTLGVGYNKLSPSGYMEYGDPNVATEVDLEDDLNLGDSKKGYAYVIFDLPVLPAIKFEYFPFQFTGRGSLNTNINFGGYTFFASSDVNTDVNFDQYDLALYYSLPIPFLHPKLGLAVKYLDGYAQITDVNTNDTSKADISLPIPMVYLGADIRIPLIPKISDIVFDLEGKWIGYSGHSITDLKLLGKVKLLGIPMIGSVFAGLGYKYLRIKVDDLDVDDKTFNSDMKFKGFLGEVGIEF